MAESEERAEMTITDEPWTTVRIRIEVGGLATEVSVGHRVPDVARAMALNLVRLLEDVEEAPGG